LITKHATKFIRDHKDEPFVLYVPHGAPHSPIQGPNSPAGRGPNKAKGKRSGKKDRDGVVKEMMKALDESIGGILDTLVESGIDKKTFVIFFSDNGGAGHMRCDPLRGRKGQVWEGGHRVPAVAWWPDRIKAGSKTDQLSISIDLMPTMLDLASVKAPSDLNFDGVSLRTVLLENKNIGPRKLFWKGQAMRDANWKLVMEKNKPHLFDLANDLSEKNDLSAKFPDRVKQMMAALEAWKSDVANGATPQPALSAPRP
jgi:arylsulfatase A-like enzyme